MRLDDSNITLIGERYLDKRHDASYIRELEAELAARGIVGLRRAAYEYVAAGALWWNMVVAEHVCLDARAVRAGWLLNAALFVIAASVAGYYLGLVAAILAVVVLHGLTLALGLLLRGGTSPTRT